MAITILINSSGEVAVTGNYTSFSRIVAAKLDIRASRFEGARVLSSLPLPARANGREAAIRATAAALGAVYPVDVALAFVDGAGQVFAEAPSTTDLARMIGTSRACVFRCLVEAERYRSPLGRGWVVHAA